MIESLILRNSKTLNKTAMIFLDNPNNPTGATLSTSVLNDIIEIAKDFDAYLHCDNALRGSELDGKPAPVPYPEYEKGIVTGSISKLEATSPRIGWIIDHEELLKSVGVVKDNTTLGHSDIGEYIAEKIMKQRENIIARNLKISQRNISILDNWIKERPEIYWKNPEVGFTGFPGYNLDLYSLKFCGKLLKQKTYY